MFKERGRKKTGKKERHLKRQGRFGKEDNASSNKNISI